MPSNFLSFCTIYVIIKAVSVSTWSLKFILVHNSSLVYWLQSRFLPDAAAEFQIKSNLNYKKAGHITGIPTGIDGFSVQLQCSRVKLIGWQAMVCLGLPLPFERPLPYAQLMLSLSTCTYSHL